MIGVFINTLPMRTELRGEEKIGAWLRKLQEEQVEMRQFEHSPLVQVQGWSEVPRGLPLFESYLNFLNYPLDDSLKNLDGPMEIHDARSIERANYPIAVDVMPGSKLTVEITYDERRFDAAGVALTLKNLEALLTGFSAHPDATLEALQEMLSESDRQEQTAKEQDLQKSLRQKIKAVRRKAV
ncbi:MAG TPA: condensation domain-containing protein, partial [Pyrinomonadaceae bacterium]|nr:condensation domain-containing protein [Pyrinomonadaceae bacterium]